MPVSMDEIGEMLDGALQEAQHGSWKTEERNENGGDATRFRAIKTKQRHANLRLKTPGNYRDF